METITRAWQGENYKKNYSNRQKMHFSDIITTPVHYQTIMAISHNNSKCLNSKGAHLLEIYLVIKYLLPKNVTKHLEVRIAMCIKWLMQHKIILKILAASMHNIRSALMHLYYSIIDV